MRALPREEKARRKRERNARWRAANKEQIKERMTAWRQKNKEKIAATERAYYEANREEILERRRPVKRAYDAARRTRMKEARDVVRLAAAMDTLITLMKLARDEAEGE